MSHLCNLAKVSSGRGARSIWLAGTSRPWLLARKPRTMFTTSRRSSVEPNQRSQEKINGSEPPRFNQLPYKNRGQPIAFYTMATIALCLMAYSIYKVYGIVSMWPEDLQDDLRKGIKHRNQGDLPLSIQHLQQAWKTAKTLPLKTLGPDPLLKTTGIAIVLAGVLEDHGDKEEAYKVYQEALSQLQTTYLDLPPDAPQPDLGGMENLKLLAPPERMRAAALCHKLGGMASELKKPEEEEQRWLNWSVNAILMAVMNAPAGSEKISSHMNTLRIMGADMRLPSWAKEHDIAAPFEALGSFYAERGINSYALPLYLQAISIIIPPPPLEASPDDRVRGARLMRNISKLILNDGRPDSIAQAIEWGQKGLDIVTAARQSCKNKSDCDIVYISLSYDLGLAYSLAGDHKKAYEFFETVVKESKAAGLKSIVKLGQEQLDKVDSKIRSTIEDKTV